MTDSEVRDDHRPDQGSSGDPCDVIVIGGGPVGVMSALLLARRGLSVRLFERELEILDLPRAVTMDAEIQRVFQNADLADELASLTTRLTGAEFVDVDGNRIIGHEFPADGLSPLGHPAGVMFHQPWLERMLRDAAAAAGAELNFGVEVMAVSGAGQAQWAAVETRGPDGSETASARWVIAADGATSPTRKALGIGFVDHGFDQDWLVFDVELHQPIDGLSRMAQQICDPARPTTVVPGHQLFRRWEFQLQPGETAAEMTRPERVWALIEPWLRPDQGTLHRAVVYRFHATVAQRFSDGPVFLAGDAAHQMPPFLGQGLCTGIRDAANLAWKLDMVSRDLADEVLLDTFDEERRPHAVNVVRHAVDTGKLIDHLAGKHGDEVGLDAGYGGGREFPHLRRGLLAGDHERVGRQVLQPTIDGTPFDEYLGDGFALLVHETADVPSDLAARWGAVAARIIEVPGGAFRRDLVPGGCIIVRPDRYVAAVATDSAELKDLTESLLGRLGR